MLLLSDEKWIATIGLEVTHRCESIPSFKVPLLTNILPLETTSPDSKLISSTSIHLLRCVMLPSWMEVRKELGVIHHVHIRPMSKVPNAAHPYSYTIKSWDFLIWRHGFTQDAPAKYVCLLKSLRLQ